jgi:hypothetical protein
VQQIRKRQTERATNYKKTDRSTDRQKVQQIRKRQTEAQTDRKCNKFGTSSPVCNFGPSVSHNLFQFNEMFKSEFLRLGKNGLATFRY